MENQTRPLNRSIQPANLPHNTNVPGAQLGARALIYPPRLTFATVIFVFLLHAPLLELFLIFPPLATMHSLAALAAGLYFLAVDEQPVRATWAIAYIAGAELLWRGAEAAPVWEYGKYATLILCLVFILKYRRIVRPGLWPVIFIALLVPGLVMPPGFDREAISFQLAGPVTMAIASLAFGVMTFKKEHLERLFLAVIAPSLSVGVLVLVALVSQESLVFGGGANETVTEGIGANQVASALSLGATLAFFYAQLLTSDRNLRRLMLATAFGLLFLSVITFSRAGLWNALGAIIAGMLIFARDRRQLSRALWTILVLGLFSYLAAFPLLVNLTGGAVTDRFADLDTTGRDDLIRIDLEVFLENWQWGVGVGQSPKEHVPFFGHAKPTHTEYSRLLAEHGVFGAAAILMLLGVTVARVFSKRSPASKGLSAALTVWALLYMFHAATRMVAPSFAFGLAAARFLLSDEDERV